MTVWDGINNSYIPAEKLTIDPSLKLHRNAEPNLDPITYEVVRHGLWNVNDELGLTIEKVSGSPFATDAHDFNSGLLTEDGEHVFFGPHAQYFAGGVDLPIKWILEHLSADPGIHDGDMFLCNDPWIGAMHQNDVEIMCPVFWEGELFCWVANTLHQYDIGGITPGSFCAEARDVFDEPVPIPPIKVVERGQVRSDLARMYVRRSRQPELMSLDLRAQIAGNTVARNRILSYVRRYGADTVKAVMRKINDDGEQAFLRRLRLIPDGVWRHAEYVEAATPEDRNIYRFFLTVRKEGDKIIFENEGTDPQLGSLNGVYAGWRAQMLVLTNVFLGYDQLFSIGGPLRHLEFRPTPGTLLSPTYPGSVSNPICSLAVSGALATACIGKMVASSAELRPAVCGVSGHSTVLMSSFSGTDQRGNPFGTGLLDIMGGAIGAFSDRDGVDTGGVLYDPRSLMPNVEATEQRFPLLYLYRRELPDSGGAGRFRGGNSAITATILHDTDEIVHSPSAGGFGVPTAPGWFGGYPGCTNRFIMRRGTDVAEHFARRSVPQSLDELSGEDEVLSPKPRSFTQQPGDVWELYWTASGGYGDPLDRDPKAVVRDIEAGSATVEAAEKIYGVKLASADGRYVVDENATSAERESRRARWASETPPRKAHVTRSAAANGAYTGSVSEYLNVVPVDGGRAFACARCDNLIGPIGENYKLHCAIDESPTSEANVHIPDSTLYVDADITFRRFHCPACGGLIDTEVAPRDVEPLWDIQLA